MLTPLNGKEVARQPDSNMGERAAEKDENMLKFIARWHCKAVSSLLPTWRRRKQLKRTLMALN